MKLFIDINKEKINEKTVVCIGNFDGVHLGHKKLLNEFNELSKQKNLKKLIITFKPHPAIYVKGKNFNLITSDYSDRLAILKKYLPDYILLQNFNEEFKNISADNFIELLIKNFNMKYLVVGKDTNFGKGRAADINFLSSIQEKYNFKLIIVDDYKIDNKKISSSYIRRLLKEGDIELVNNYLYENFYIKGFVVTGRMMGRKLSYPTANLKEYSSNQILPKNGVYITKTFVEGVEYRSMTNIGNNPSFENADFSVETHIFNFNENIYFKKIRVKFLKKIREEIKFNNIEDLKNQLNKDKNFSLKYFNKF